jgi:hypothetical protein
MTRQVVYLSDRALDSMHNVLGLISSPANNNKEQKERRKEGKERGREAGREGRKKQICNN